MSTDRNPAHAQGHKLLTVAEAAGVTVPDKLLAAAETERRLGVLLADARQRSGSTDATTVADQAVEELLAAAQAGESAPTDLGARQVAAEARQRQNRLEVDLLTRAVEEAIERCARAARAAAPLLIETSLTKRLAEVLELARRRAPLAARVPWDDTVAALRSPDEIKKTYLELTEAAAVYSSLRTAQALCFRLRGGENEATSIFGELRNLREVWPSVSRQGPGTSNAPWPKDPRQRLVWLATSSAQPWMPTKEQCEAEWTRVAQAARAVRDAMAPRAGGIFVETR